MLVPGIAGWNAIVLKMFSRASAGRKAANALPSAVMYRERRVPTRDEPAFVRALHHIYARHCSLVENGQIDRFLSRLP